MKFFKQALILFHALSFLLMPSSSPAGEINELIIKKEEVSDQVPKDKLKAVADEKDIEKAKQQTASVNDKILAAAEMGDPDSQNFLGLFYLNGEEGNDMDADKAEYWLSRAAENGHVDAQNDLSLLYLNGMGVEKDRQKGMFWLQKAAENGNVYAQSNLGQIYYFERNYLEASFWISEAAMQGHAKAQNNLAIMYSKGLGFEQNTELAIYWLQKAADQGDSSALRNLAKTSED